MDFFKINDFVFSSKARVLRHIVFWVVYTVFGTLTFYSMGESQGIWKHLFYNILLLPVRMLYCYPLMYWVLPKYLLKERFLQFTFIILLWAIAGYFLNYMYRAYIFIPIQKALHFTDSRNPGAPGTYLMMTTTAGITSMIVLFKYWAKKQQEWLHAEKEKVTVELQLLKAQVHPHFLFNTLNNIYSFALEKSPRTPELILKLSSLLSYILYDCKTEEVLLEKELEVMKNYIDLEKERYGNNIEISLNFEGEIKGQYIAPLLLLPFLENAFKHGTSEQLEKPWLSVDVAVKQHKLKCKIVNSKNECVPVRENGIGIKNVKKRLEFLYPNKHELKMNDEEDFFAVSLLVELNNDSVYFPKSLLHSLPAAEKIAL